MLPNYKDFDPDEELLMPQTEEELDYLVDTLVTEFGLTDSVHAAMVVANQIQRLPPDNAYTTKDFLGQSILKSIAYSVALHKTRKLSQKAQIDLISATLKANPFDQQALDALEIASNEGSEYATEILSLYRPVDAGDNVVQMNSVIITDENQGPVV